MSLKEITVIFVFIIGLHFSIPFNTFARAKAMEKFGLTAPDFFQSTQLFNYSDSDKPEKSKGWEEMHFRTVKNDKKIIHFIVSSELDPVNPLEGQGRYGGHLLFDNDTTTAWVEGAEGQGQGEFIIFEAGEDYPEKVIIHSGYQKSDRLFKMNSRPHLLEISLYAGFYIEGYDSEITSRYILRPVSGTGLIELDDITGAQAFPIPFNEAKVMEAKDASAILFLEDYSQEIQNIKNMCPTCDSTTRFSFFIRLEIRDIYKGSEWADNCISEVAYFSRGKARRSQTGPTEGTDNQSAELAGQPAGKDRRPAGISQYPESLTGTVESVKERILDVYEDEDPDAGIIYVDCENRKGIILVNKSELEENGIIEKDEKVNIVLMDVSPDREWAQVDFLVHGGREGRIDEYSVLYNIRLLRRVDESILGTKYGMFGFVEDKGKIWLDTIDGFIDLEMIRDRMLKADGKK